MNEEQEGREVLVHWIYTREEWRVFLRWRKLKRGVLPFLIHLVTTLRLRNIPEIRITHYNVMTATMPELFNGLYRELKRVDIKDAGSLNILEIVYEKTEEKNTLFTEIHIPVPKGKLREAIRLQQDLSSIIPYWLPQVQPHPLP